MDLLIVNLNETASYKMSFRSVTFSYCHDLTKSSRNYTFTLLGARTHHGMRFSTTSLPICKYRAIITVKNTIN